MQNRGRCGIIVFGIFILAMSSVVRANDELYSSLFGLMYDDGDSDTVYNCTIPNDCAFAPGRPYCLNGQCRQCNPNAGEKVSSCECRAGQYCIKYPEDPDYGFCREYESGIVDRNCDVRLQDGMQVIQGVNDTVFCGRVIFASNNTALFVEWTGSCQVGVCKVCKNPIIPTVPTSICNDGRSCLDGYEIYALVGAFSLSYITKSPIFTAYYVAISEVVISAIVVALTLFGYYYYYRQGKKQNIHWNDNYTILPDEYPPVEEEKSKPVIAKPKHKPKPTPTPNFNNINYDNNLDFNNHNNNNNSDDDFSKYKFNNNNLVINNSEDL